MFTLNETPSKQWVNSEFFNFINSLICHQGQVIEVSFIAT